VHNSRLLSQSEKKVLYGPFRAFPRRPPWFVTNRNLAKIGAALCDFKSARSAARLAKVALLSLRA
jgi:hypothetical protein